MSQGPLTVTSLKFLKQVNVHRLVSDLLQEHAGMHCSWRSLCKIDAAYVPPFADSKTSPRVIVRFNDSFLRYSAGPRQGYFWDVYGDDFLRVELALLSLAKAPPPPGIYNEDTRERVHKLIDAGGVTET